MYLNRGTSCAGRTAEGEDHVEDVQQVWHRIFAAIGILEVSLLALSQG